MYLQSFLCAVWALPQDLAHHTRPQHNFLNPSGLGFCLVHVQLMLDCPRKHASSAAACKSASMMRRGELATAQSAPCPSGASAGNGPASHASVFHQLSGPTSHNMDWKLQCSMLFWLVAQRLSQKSGSPSLGPRIAPDAPICSPFAPHSDTHPSINCPIDLHLELQQHPELSSPPHPCNPRVVLRQWLKLHHHPTITH